MVCHSVAADARATETGNLAEPLIYVIAEIERKSRHDPALTQAGEHCLV